MCCTNWIAQIACSQDVSKKMDDMHEADDLRNCQMIRLQADWRSHLVLLPHLALGLLQHEAISLESCAFGQTCCLVVLRSQKSPVKTRKHTCRYGPKQHTVRCQRWSHAFTSVSRRLRHRRVHQVVDRRQLVRRQWI